MHILALHGFTGCGGDFAPFAELVDGQWHCPNLPGHGAAPQLDCTPAATIDLVQKERLTFHAPRPTTKNILLGYSMGARAALLHATQYPEAWDALILISGNPGIESETLRNQRCTADVDLANSIEAKGVASFLDFWQQTPLIRSQESIPIDWRHAMQANRLRHTAKGLANSLRQFGQGSVPNLWPEVSKLTMPVCLITGALDSKYTEIAQRLLPTLPERCSTHSELHAAPSTHTVISNASHMPHLEQANASAIAINAFIESL